MREIIFRGFHKCENGKDKISLNGEWIPGKWVYGNLVISNDVIDGYEMIIIPQENANLFVYDDGEIGATVWFNVIPETVGQYTGKTDKNKTRVFDGDIIRILNAKQPLEVGVVRWNDDDQCYVVCSTWSERCILTDFRNLGRSKFEVIGNIHINSELLEVTE